MDREKVISWLEGLAEDDWRECYSDSEVQETARQALNLIDELLKEQEAGHWILLENCSNSGVYCSECHTKVFDNYPFKKKFSYFCPHCGTRMEGETERQLDTNLRLT